MSGEQDGGGTRRDFLYLATGAAGVVAVGGIALPLVSQLAPNAREVAAGAPVEIDISAIEPGMQLTILWRGKPYFIRRLTEKEVTAVDGAPEGDFRDFVAADSRIVCARRRQERMGDRGRQLHASGLCSNQGRERTGRLDLPVPRLEIRRAWPSHERACTDQPAIATL